MNHKIGDIVEYNDISLGVILSINSITSLIATLGEHERINKNHIFNDAIYVPKISYLDDKQNQELKDLAEEIKIKEKFKLI